MLIILKKRSFFDNKTVLPYQLGVYTTAWARWELQCAINLIPYKNFLYCDTDSVYYIDDDNINFDEYNKEKIKNSTKNRAYAKDIKGKLHYMGVFEVEHTKITQFKTLGAKKYGFLELKPNKKGIEEEVLFLTVAGVSKKYGAKELILSQCPLYNERTAEVVKYCPLKYKAEDKKSVLTLFSNDVYDEDIEEGFTFNKAGGTEIVYNDKYSKYASITLEIEGRMLYIPTSAVIRESTYKVTLDTDYTFLLENLLNSGALEQYIYSKWGINADIMEQ